MCCVGPEWFIGFCSPVINTEKSSDCELHFQPRWCTLSHGCCPKNHSCWKLVAKEGGLSASLRRRGVCLNRPLKTARPSLSFQSQFSLIHTSLISSFYPSLCLLLTLIFSLRIIFAIMLNPLSTRPSKPRHGFCDDEKENSYNLEHTEIMNQRAQCILSAKPKHTNLVYYDKMSFSDSIPTYLTDQDANKIGVFQVEDRH
jgi:hypothetical protein